MKIYRLVFLLATLCSDVFANPDTWVQKAPLPGLARAAAVAFSLNGNGYVGTGLDSAGNLLDDFWKYDPAVDSWSQVASFAGSARKNAVAIVTDSFAYVGTGYDNAGLTHDFYRYDGMSNSWTQTSNLDSAGAVYPRRDAAAFSLGDTGYVVGGYDGTSFYSSETWQFVASRDTAWKEKTAFPVAGRRWATGFALAGCGYVGMGYNFSQEYFHDFWKYYTTSNTWTQIADFAGNKRAYAISFVLNGYAYVGSGFDGALKSDFYMYDPVNNQWMQVAPFAGLPISAACGFSLAGKGYLFGGTDTTGFKNELWEYTPDNTAGIGSNPEVLNDCLAFPNPADGIFQFKNLPLISGETFKLKLFDASGNLSLVKTLAKGDVSVSAKGLAPGIYYYSLLSDGENNKAVTGKVIIR